MGLASFLAGASSFLGEGGVAVLAAGLPDPHPCPHPMGLNEVYGQKGTLSVWVALWMAEQEMRGAGF